MSLIRRAATGPGNGPPGRARVKVRVDCVLVFFLNTRECRFLSERCKLSVLALIFSSKHDEGDVESFRYGLGNDFIVLDARKDPKLSAAGEPKRATLLTDRKIGIVSGIFRFVFRTYPNINFFEIHNCVVIFCASGMRPVDYSGEMRGC